MHRSTVGVQAAAWLMPGLGMIGSTLAAAASPVPLCAGLTIVTAVSQTDGDYESIKTIESLDAQTLRLKYSSERMVIPFLSNEPAKLQKLTLHRSVRLADLADSHLYLQQYYDKLPELVPGTTAIGTSRAVLTSLKAAGTADIGIFIGFSGQDETIDRNVHPNVYDNQMLTKVSRIETNPVTLPVLVNDATVQLPAIHAGGDYFGDKTEFWFLDDPANPITLRYRFGIGALSSADALPIGAQPTTPPKLRDRDDLDVIKIAFNCPAQAATSSGTAASDDIERSLETTGKAEVYDIYFSFNSDQLREESGPELQRIATVLQRHPDWKLAVRGHTDNIGGADYNLRLSKSRAAAVKNSLVQSYRVDAARLSTDGFGASQPQDSNDTLEGRAHNRRVELVKL